MKLTTTTVTIPVERDGQAVGELCFDPQDVAFAQSFLELLEGLAEQEKRYSDIDQKETAARLTALRGLCDWLTGQIDALFGAGSSEMLFGGRCSLELFRQFFAGIEPVIRRARAKKTAKFRQPDEGVME